MNERTLIDRLLSPAGFGLALLLFLLPFLSVSCSTEEGPVVATFSGVDMVVGGEPDLRAPTTDQEAQEAQRTIVAIFQDRLDAEPLAILAVLAILFGMGAGLVRLRLARHAISAGLAVVAIALIAGAFVRSSSRVGDALRSLSDSPEPVAYQVQMRYGFWLCVGALSALTFGHLFGLLRAWKAPPTARRAEADPADIEFLGTEREE